MPVAPHSPHPLPEPPPASRPDPPDADPSGGETTGPCPNCGAPMNAIRGSKLAICANCGFKDSCCF
ncbi:MAG TPA: hypothetical protein VM536_08660 [Chloroflexia bacterium]|nr:hypothetical protein [Chloroflexia bacterium]